MKLIVQIPCYNEEKTLPQVITDIPRKIEGIDEVQILIINDGSTDNTVEVAKEMGVDYILENPRKLGLSKSFVKGLEACLYFGADIIVNTDGDNQYRGEDIKTLVKILLERNSDMVIGCRDIVGHTEFSLVKKFFQGLGSKVVSRLGSLKIPDVTSGFRSYSRNAAMKTTVINDFSYTAETLIQAGCLGMKVDWVPIQVNKKTRESRLFHSTFHYMQTQSFAILKSYLLYRPIHFFFTIGGLSLLVALASGVRFAYYVWFIRPEEQVFKMGSGILLQFSLILAVVCFLGGFLGTVLSGLRTLIEEMRFDHKRQILSEERGASYLETHVWKAGGCDDL
jgi:glycosyltransferase involved in cell wall biosynthesis|tara:strand:+ start:619 stop:1629 length:1011 start_codon:yes stop_codon:yes gene_type:complete